MSSLQQQARSLAINRGLILFGLLTAFFLVMRWLNLAHIFELRVLNFIFVFFTLRSAIHGFHKKAKASYYEDFIDFFKIAMFTAAVGILLFALFIALYLDLIDPAFMAQLKEYQDSGGVITPVVAAVALLLEGMASAIICAFVIIQWRKSRTVERPIEESTTKLKHEAKTD